MVQKRYRKSFLRGIEFANKLRYSQIPVVAGVRGYALAVAGDCMLHCVQLQQQWNHYIGLVEAGVGLLPGWGGSTEMAVRCCSARPMDGFN